MGKNKLFRFAENATFKNLFQHTDYRDSDISFPMKGNWKMNYFKNNHPIILELGCGKGEYTIGMAARYPDNNYVGIDRKGARLWRGCKDALEQGLDNVAFLRIKIDDIANYFAEGEVSEIWITFPDPQPKKERRRLVSPNFIDKYSCILSEDGLIHLKTDSREFYEYFIEQIREHGWDMQANIEDVYGDNDSSILTEIQTFYERMWLREGKTISYIRAGGFIKKTL